jgi:hypothetical protein
VDDYKSQGIEVAEIRIQRVTEGLHAVEVLEHGQQDPERYFLSAEEA